MNAAINLKGNNYDVRTEHFDLADIDFNVTQRLRFEYRWRRGSEAVFSGTACRHSCAGQCHLTVFLSFCTTRTKIAEHRRVKDPTSLFPHDKVGGAA